MALSLESSKTVAGFLYARFIRIFPALIITTVVSALILGPLLTTLPLGEYFHGADFRQYFLNCIGDIHYQLPGLFANNPYPDHVNGQLWTIPYELKCYFILAAISLIGMARNRWLLLTSIATIFVIYAFHFITHPDFDLKANQRQ